MSKSEVRLRERPESRFATSQDHLDLNEEAALLAREPDSGQHGHRQKTLMREGRLTVALYLFEAGSHLPQHVVDGEVLIQVLEGRLAVVTAEGTYDLAAGHLLRLSPAVRHEVAATDPSQMLLTVALEGSGSHT